MERSIHNLASISTHQEVQPLRTPASYIHRIQRRSRAATRHTSRGSSVGQSGGTGSISTCSSGRDLSRHVPVSSYKAAPSTHDLRNQGTSQVYGHFGLGRYGLGIACERSVSASDSQSSSQALRRTSTSSRADASKRDERAVESLGDTQNTRRRSSRHWLGIGCITRGNRESERSGCVTGDVPAQGSEATETSRGPRRRADACPTQAKPGRVRAGGVNDKEQLMVASPAPVYRSRGERQTGCGDGGWTGDGQLLNDTPSEPNRTRRRRRGKASKRWNGYKAETPAEWSTENVNSEGEHVDEAAPYGEKAEAARSALCRRSSNGQYKGNGRELSSGVGDVSEAACISEIHHIPGQSIDRGLVAQDSKKAIEEGVRMILRAMGEDVTRPGLQDTPTRVAAAMEFFSQGYRADPKEVVKDALFSVEEGLEEGDCLTGNQGMVTVGQLDVSSLCEHHLLPFVGKCHIGYIPDKHVLGLSKFARIMRVYACRLQIQERLTQQIALAVMKIVKPRGVAVLLECKHMCMAMRGVSTPGSMTTTTAFRGVFE
ncbi:GTP cyclohydrolase, related [Neospora caninum Liverpool]|nr:GTP cyclohydrolase, related [Neospora caninum Liverpool]CBZ50341.1 GTP cyclohydrolase, related [Neospora caninum Liverpool]|eukprot:XP_003880375.1 GTP cyclohydrolase, related [Neospora caninum Liverpool]